GSWSPSFFFSIRRRHTRFSRDWSSDVCSSDLSETFARAWARVVELTPKILLFLLILIVGWLIARAVSSLLDTVLEKVGFDRWVRSEERREGQSVELGGRRVLRIRSEARPATQ